MTGLWEGFGCKVLCTKVLLHVVLERVLQHFCTPKEQDSYLLLLHGRLVGKIKMTAERDDETCIERGEYRITKIHKKKEYKERRRLGRK